MSKVDWKSKVGCLLSRRMGASVGLLPPKDTTGSLVGESFPPTVMGCVFNGIRTFLPEHFPDISSCWSVTRYTVGLRSFHSSHFYSAPSSPLLLRGIRLISLSRVRLLFKHRTTFLHRCENVSYVIYYFFYKNAFNVFYFLNVLFIF